MKEESVGEAVTSFRRGRGILILVGEGQRARQTRLERRQEACRQYKWSWTTMGQGEKKPLIR